MWLKKILIVKLEFIAQKFETIIKKIKIKKGCESRFPYCFLTDLTNLFFRGSSLLDFGSLTQEASWIHGIFKI